MRYLPIGDIPQEFDHFELTVKDKVRFISNDLRIPVFAYVGMGKKKKRQTSWFGAEWPKGLGLQQTDLIAGTEYSKSQVSEYVNGKHRFNEDALLAFARVMKLHPSDLL